MVSADLVALKDDEYLAVLLMGVFLTLFGAVAWLLLTRMDIAVYVSSLQRIAKKPKALHMRRLNRVVRYVLEVPQRLRYGRLQLPVKLVPIGDSAYQEQFEADRLVVRGMIYALAHETKQKDRVSFEVQVLDWLAGKQQHVVRGV